MKTNIPIPEKLPFLESICWQTKDVYQFAPGEMLSRYEQGWKYHQIFDNLGGEELDFIQKLARTYHSWLQVSLPMPFTLDHHIRILTILQSLDANLLEQNLAYFGGGTCIALDFDEYRLSNDVDFACPFPSDGYKHLRNIIFNRGYEALFSDLSQIQVGTGRSDQYGIRLGVDVGATPIKIEIIAEGRFELDPPRYPAWSPVACLSINDCFTSKLLANADRYMDDSVQSRDLIDLAVLRLQSPIPPEAIAKAERAYEVIRPLQVAIQRFQQREDDRERFFDNLFIGATKIPVIMNGVDLLAQDLGLEVTARSFKEQHDLL